MATRRRTLPKTVKGCHRLIRELNDTIDELRARVAHLERELYGAKRERFIPERPSAETPPSAAMATPSAAPPPIPCDTPLASLSPHLDDGAAEEEATLSLEEALPAPARETRRTSSGRRPRVLPADTPRVKVYHPLDPSQISPEWLYHPDARRFFRLVREEVEMPRRQVRILQHYQEVIAWDDAEALKTTMIAAQLPEPLIPRCSAGNSLLAYLAASRFADHLPYYREEDILCRSGISIPRSTQWRWMRKLARALLPLVGYIRQRLLECNVLGIDETPCPILDPSLPQTRKAYLYAQYGDDSQPYVGYYFADHKTRENIEAMLVGFEGVLQSDAYICYELITEASLNRIQPAACWAHGRRKFEPLLVPGKKTPASWILLEIQRLYDIEDRARSMSDDDRRTLRQQESRPIVDQIHAWMLARDARERPRAPIRQGVNYFLKRWDSFTRFLEEGAIPIDNNRTEAAIKGPVMGKKNWLFFGNATGGETAAAMYTIVMTCKRHHVDPYAYLCDVLDRLQATSEGDFESLMPHRWIESHPEARMVERIQESHAAAFRKRTRRALRRRAIAAR